MKNMVLFLALLLVIPSVDAGLGVARDHIPGNTIRIHPGDSIWYGMRIQNPDDKSVKIKVSIDGNRELLRLIKDEYTIPANSYDTEVRMYVDIPNGAIRGSEYDMVIKIGSIVGESENQVSLVGSVAFQLKIMVAEENEVATLISRQDLTEQVYPCLTDNDCPSNMECKDRICFLRPNPPPVEVVEEDGFGLIWVLGGFIAVLLVVRVFLWETYEVWSLRRTISDKLNR